MKDLPNAASRKNDDEKIGAAAGEVLNAAGELGRQSEILRTEITRFLDQIRAV